MQVTDEALERIAQAVRDRDVTIAFLQQRLADLTAPPQTTPTQSAFPPADTSPTQTAFQPADPPDLTAWAPAHQPADPPGPEEQPR